MDIRSLTSPAPTVSSPSAQAQAAAHAVAAIGGALPPRTDVVNTAVMHAAENTGLHRRIEALMVRTLANHARAVSGCALRLSAAF
eukprot:COSAG02_NODE_2508_length_8634_cov_2.849326_6_plen_85_part_00